MNTFRSFEDLNAWKLSRSFKIMIRNYTKQFPTHEKFGLISQIIRSSRSVSANIAEGWGRYHYQENIQFCRHARGSLFETLDHLIEAKDCEYITEIQFTTAKMEFDICLKVLNGYISYLKTLKESQT
jgi:four helix bundle protein